MLVGVVPAGLHLFTSIIYANFSSLLDNYCYVPTALVASALRLPFSSHPNQDPLHPLHIYAGHLNADPSAARLPDTTVTSHLYFVLVKARRTADRERILFWFNVSTTCMPNMLAVIDTSHTGGSRMFIL